MPVPIRFVNGNTKELLSELPFEEAPDSFRYVFIREGRVVPTREEAELVLEVTRIVHYTFDKTGNLAPPERAATGFLKYFDAEGRMVKEAFTLMNGHDGGLYVPRAFRGDEG